MRLEKERWSDLRTFKDNLLVFDASTCHVLKYPHMKMIENTLRRAMPSDVLRLFVTIYVKIPSGTFFSIYFRSFSRSLRLSPHTNVNLKVRERNRI